MVEGKHIHTAEQEKEPAGEPPPLRGRLAARTGFGDKTLWDVLQLLIVPLALAAIGFFFSLQQDRRQDAIEDKRAASEQKIEEQRAQDAALQAYLDEMSSLLLTNGSLRESEEGSEVRTLARARTITVVERLNPQRKAEVLRFLVEANLVQSVGGRAPIITLNGADLDGVILSGAVLSKPVHTKTVQTRFGPIAEPPDLQDLANEQGPNAQLWGTNMSGAFLPYADLREAQITETDLSCADLSYADLSGATLSGDLSYTDLSGADLSGATLSADLKGALLIAADLSGVDLSKEQRQDAIIEDEPSPVQTATPSCQAERLTKEQRQEQHFNERWTEAFTPPRD
jgi:uncharacterized protein YjbI with pentapeptide repeats